MSKKLIQKPLAAAIGAAFVTSLSGAPMANASENPFSATQLSSGYMVADSHMEGKCGEGKCGGKPAAKAMEGKCGEGKCGGMKMMDADGDGKVTKAEFMAGHEKLFSRKDKNNDGVIDAGEMKMMEGKCGEGKCGGAKPAAKAMEGKCGEGKCGGSK